MKLFTLLDSNNNNNNLPFCKETQNEDVIEEAKRKKNNEIMICA